ncbi:MAG: hypothetical protein ABI451_07035 [Dokdonella sp.]
MKSAIVLKVAFLIIALLIALPVAAQTTSLSYSYFELDGARLDKDGLPAGNGGGFRASGELGSNFNVIAGWSQINVDTPFLDHVRPAYLGFGYHLPMNATTDLFAEATYNDLDPIDNGYGARVGVRSKLADRFEAGAAIAYAKIKNIDANTALDVYGQYFITRNIGIVAEAALGNSEKTYLVGVRISN